MINYRVQRAKNPDDITDMVKWVIVQLKLNPLEFPSISGDLKSINFKMDHLDSKHPYNLLLHRIPIAYIHQTNSPNKGRKTSLIGML
jgi:hypothetical protein